MRKFLKRKQRSEMTPPSVNIFFDLETSGLSFKTNKIIQVGAYCPQLQATYSRYVRIDTPLTALITELTGINDVMLEEGESESVVLDSFFAFIRTCITQSQSQGAVLVSYNGFKFDEAFLDVACKRVNSNNLYTRAKRAGVDKFVDALVWVRNYLPGHFISNLPTNRFGKPSYRQRDVYFAMFAEMYEEHRADSDCTALARICVALPMTYDTGRHIRLTGLRPQVASNKKLSKRKLSKPPIKKVVETMHVLSFLRTLHQNGEEMLE